jgi:hypothetical protein
MSATHARRVSKNTPQVLVGADAFQSVTKAHERLRRDAWGLDDHNLCFDIADQHAHQGALLMSTITEILQALRGVADQHKVLGVPQDSNTDPIAKHHPPGNGCQYTKVAHQH